MSGLKTKKAGSIERGVMVGLTGPAGAGKTTLAATFPKPLVLDLEGGAWVLSEQGTDVYDDFAKKPQCRHTEMLSVLRMVAESELRTVIIDSWTRLSEWLEADILEEDGRATSLNAALGGYGKGADCHVNRTAKMIEALQWLQVKRKMHVVWVLHESIGSVDLPTGESFSYFGNEGAKKSTKRVIMACDVVAQLRQAVQVVDQTKDGAGRAIGDGHRELFVGSAPYADTKSRFDSEPRRIKVERGTNPLAYCVQ